MSKMKLLMGASALIVAASGAAQAQVVTVYGGGASLPAPYIRQSADCFGNKVNLLERVSATASPIVSTISDFNYVNINAALAYNCADVPAGNGPVDANATLNYISTGSGTGIATLFSHDSSRYGDIDAATLGVQNWETAPGLKNLVHFGASDAAIGTFDVQVWNNGPSLDTSVSPPVTTGTIKVTSGITVAAPGTNPIPAGQIRNPKEVYGNLVQFPLLIAPVAIAYDPVYKKVADAAGVVTSYSFALKSAKTAKINNVTYQVGGLPLDADAYCKIFKGTIKDWNAAELTALNGGQSLRAKTDPVTTGWSVPLQIVGRSDSSGTTSIWTRHLAAVCSGGADTDYTNGATTLPSGLRGPTYDKTLANTAPAGEVLGKYTLAAGNDGVAKYIDFSATPAPSATLVQGRMGYVGIDWTNGYATATGSAAVGYALHVAMLKNFAPTPIFVLPSPAAANLAFGTTLLPPQSTTKGAYNAGDTTFGLRTNAADWVQSTSKTSVLAKPTGAKAYTIVGTSNFIGYTCYQDAAVAAKLKGYLNWYFSNKVTTDTKVGILTLSGFSPMPTAWQTAIRDTFVSNKNGLNLHAAGIAANASPSVGNTSCQVAGVTGA